MACPPCASRTRWRAPASSRTLHRDSSMGGPHTEPASARDIDHGKMDGFIAEAESRCGPHTGTCKARDVMGYHTGTDIPNYWAYAKNFVLDDMMFESDHSWSLPSHLAAAQEPRELGLLPRPRRAEQQQPERRPADLERPARVQRRAPGRADRQ